MGEDPAKVDRPPVHKNTFNTAIGKVEYDKGDLEGLRVRRLQVGQARQEDPAVNTRFGPAIRRRLNVAPRFPAPGRTTGAGAIWARVNMSDLIPQLTQQFFNGLSLGAIYALIAIGCTMVYGIIGLINFAHGEIYMIGAPTSAWSTLTAIGTNSGLPLPSSSPPCWWSPSS